MNAVTTPVLHPSSPAVEVPASEPSMMDSAERIMVTAALAGDDEAFETVIRTYSRSLFAVAFAILRDRGEAEDVVQETLLKAYKTRWRVRSVEKFQAWLASVARNRALDVLRRRRWERALRMAEPTADPEGAPVRGEPS